MSVCLLLAWESEGGEIAFENNRLRVALGDNAVWNEITDRLSGKNYAYTATRTSFASVRMGSKSHTAQAITRRGDQIQIRFRGTDITVTCRVETTEDWMAFEVLGVEGGRPEIVEFLRAPVAITERVGRRLNVAWNDHYAVCVAGI